MIYDQEYEELICKKYFHKNKATKAYQKGNIKKATKHENIYYEICGELQDFIENYKLVSLYIINSIE